MHSTFSAPPKQGTIPNSFFLCFCFGFEGGFKCVCVCVFFWRILCVICVRHSPQLLFALKVAPSLQHSSVNSVNSLLHADCRKSFPVCRLPKFCPSLHSTGICCRWMYMQYIDCRLPNLAICNPRGHLHVTYWLDTLLPRQQTCLQILFYFCQILWVFVILGNAPAAMCFVHKLP